MKGAELFVRCLENEGVDTIFGIPGEENIDVMDVLLGSHRGRLRGGYVQRRAQ